MQFKTTMTIKGQSFFLQRRDQTGSPDIAYSKFLNGGPGR
jgi:hypothetical protein